MAGGGTLPPDEQSTILYIGQHEGERREPVSSSYLAKAQDLGYDLLTTRVTTETFQSRVLSTLGNHVNKFTISQFPTSVPLPLISPLTPQDTDLSPNDANSSLIAIASPWIDLSSKDPLIAHISQQVFGLEIAYAAFCGISNVLVHGPISSRGAVQYARAMLEALGVGPFLQMHLLLPMTGELEQDVSADGLHLSQLARPQYAEQSENEGGPDLYASWEIWNTVRTICEYSNKLSIALEIPRQLPALSLQSRWFSEPVRLLILPRTSFVRNPKGYPTLSKQQQQYLTRFFRLRFPPWVLLCDVGSISQEQTDSVDGSARDPTPGEAANAPAPDLSQETTLHLEYMRHLQQTQPSRPPTERFAQGYQDYLQSPLQPLTDNLESITYEVFEKDPVKYEWYERAVALALHDICAKLGSERKIVVAVVGAGRGPLVTRALKASRSTGVEISAWAVEKNPNAHVLLQHRNATDPLWNTQVTVIKSDMRTWPGPLLNGEVGKVDILISELLGSFADNELSPECLYGVQHVLHPEHGISIPQSYSAHFTPIAAPRLHADLLGRTMTDLNMSVMEKWELPYVVMLHQYDYLSVLPPTTEDPRTPDVKEAWSFSHPAACGIYGSDGTNEYNKRSCSVSFKCPDGGVCHGLAGYFETVLYASESTGQKVELSTNLVTMNKKSKDMISWFPIFFPLKTPLSVPDDAEMAVTMWRQTDERKVWYEWLVEVYQQGAGGNRRKLGMSELHSTRRNGCLK